MPKRLAELDILKGGGNIIVRHSYYLHAGAVELAIFIYQCRENKGTQRERTGALG